MYPGPYVAEGYFKDDDSKVFVNGWFTLKIFLRKDGHYFIIDKKRTSIKTVEDKQLLLRKLRIFSKTDSIKNVFLVGDGKEF